MPEDHDRPGFAFGPEAPPEVAGYLRNKGLRPSFSWLDVESEEHAIQFAVAKAVNIDVLNAIRGGLQMAIDDGVPFEKFKRELRPQLEKLGWWGIQKRRDPVTGEEKLVRLGSPRRLKTIYDANLRTARAAGEWNRIQRTKGGLPYLLYELGPSENHRPEHVARAGIVLPVDDPLWRVWYPPNGWGCKCRVRQLTRAQAEDHGISEPVAIETRKWVNRRTGEEKDIPVGIDPGWERNPGIDRQGAMERFLAGKIDEADEAVAKTVTADITDSWRFRRLLDGASPGEVPVAVLPRSLRDVLGTDRQAVTLSGRTVRKMRDRHPEIGTPEAYRLVQRIIGDPQVPVIMENQRDLQFVWTDGDGRAWIMAIELNREDRPYLATLYKAKRPGHAANVLERGRRLR